MKAIFSKVSTDQVFFYTLSILILTLPYNISSWWVGTFSILLFLIAVTNPLKKERYFSVFSKQPVLAFLIFILFSYLSVIWSDSSVFFNGDLKTNVSRFKYFFLLVPAIYLSNLSKKDIEKLFVVIAASPALSIAIYYSNYLGYSAVYPVQNHNGDLILRHYLIQNFFILFSVLFLYINIFNTLGNKDYRNFSIYLILFFIVSLSLVIDEHNSSRLMVLSYVIILITVPYYFLRPKVYFSLIFILLAVSSFGIAHIPSFQRGIDNFKQAIHADEYDGSWGHRFGYAIMGIDIFLNKPILGYGINDTSRHIIEYANEHPKYFIGENLRRFHNEHINILVATGVIGYSLFLYFIFLFYKLKISDRSLYIFKNTMIIVILFSMMGEHYLTLKSTVNFFIILLALFVKYENSAATKANRDISS